MTSVSLRSSLSTENCLLQNSLLHFRIIVSNILYYKKTPKTKPFFAEKYHSVINVADNSFRLAVPYKGRFLLAKGIGQ